MTSRLAWLAVSVAALCGAVCLSACRPGSPAQRQPGPVRAVVSIAPLERLVQRLLPADAEVTVLIAPGRSEHGYELTAADATALNRADLVVYVGLGLEAQVETYLGKHPVSTRRDVSFAGAVGIASPAGAPHHEDHHDGDGDDDEHDRGGVDPHLWLDPALVRQFIPQARAEIERVLKAQGFWSDAAKDRLDAAEAALLKDIAAIDDEYRTRLAPLKGQSIVTHHAAWGRLAERYGLKVAAVIRPFEGVEPTPEAVAAAARAVREQHVTTIFVEPQFNARAAERIAELTQVRIATLDPLGDGDWFTLMRANLDSLAENLRR